MALASQPIPLSARRTLRILVPAECWHLLSLDAPSVATLWAWSFARAFHITLFPYSLPLLFAGTWLIYVADRILDGFHQDSARLRERHLFYIRHRVAVAATAIPVSFFLAWLILFHMLPGARRADVLIFAFACAYFALVHLGGRDIERCFPKELVVALVFAAATSVPAFARLVPASSEGPSQDRAVLVLMSALFAALCWLNCIAIEKWEQPLRSSPAPGRDIQIAERTTRWGQRHLRPISLVLSTVAIASAALLLHFNPSVAGLCFTAAVAAALFIPLDRSPLSVFHLRIAADAALLTPLLLLFIR